MSVWKLTRPIKGTTAFAGPHAIGKSLLTPVKPEPVRRSFRQLRYGPTRCSAAAGLCRAADDLVSSASSTYSNQEDFWTIPPEDPIEVADLIESNRTSLQLTFLGTQADQGSPSGRKFCLAVRTTRSCLLFECPEDAQRALLHAPHIRPRSIDRIFISCLDGDNICGLPGMLCTVSAARERGHEGADIPLHVYGPVGIAAYVDTLLQVSDTYLLMPVLVHELSIRAPNIEGFEDEPEAWQPEMMRINKRAGLHVATLPPDQLNPTGFYDASQTPLPGNALRHQRRGGRRKKSRRDGDPRSGHLPLPLPPHGNPEADGIAVADMTWTIRSDASEYMVVASPQPHAGAPCLAYTLVEADRSGMLDPEKATALGVKPGKAFAALKAGESVTTSCGHVVQSSDVVGPGRPGRRLLMLPDTSSPTAPPLARNAQAVIAPASCKGESMAETMGQLAAEISAEHLLLTRFALHDTIGEAGETQRKVDRAQKLAGAVRVYAAEDSAIKNIDRT